MPERVLKAVLERHNLARPDGRPLYRYRITDEEYAALERAGRALFKTRDVQRTLDQAAALCLYAAERFCRHYSGGTYAWEMITASLGYKGDVQHLYPLVRAGLRRLGREVHVGNGAREYLGTLIIEGGLPRWHLAGEHAGRFRDWLREALREIERNPKAEPDQCVKERAPFDLPRFLQNSDTYAILADVVRWVRDMRGAYLVVDAPDPIAVLDRHAPAWRDECPFRPDDDVARALLRGLLAQARPAASETIRVVLSAEVDGPRWSFSRAIRLPSVVSPHTLERWTGVPAKPSRVYAHTVHSDGDRRCIATLTRHQDMFRVAPARGNSPGLSKVWAGGMTLVLSAAERDIGEVELVGGSDIANLPWIFSDVTPPTHQFSGGGGIRADSALVVVPAGSSGCASDGSSWEQVGESADAKRIVFRLRGAVSVDIDGEQFTLSTRTEQSQSEWLLEGRSIRLGPGGTVAYRGVPRLIEVNGDVRRPVNTMEWRPGRRGGGEWCTQATPGCLGDVSFRYRIGGQTKFLARAVILPAQTFARFRSVKERVGRVVFEGVELAGVDSLTPTITATLEERAGAADVVLEAQGDEPVPSYVTLRLRLSTTASAEVRVPFPSRAAEFVRASGEVWTKGTSIYIDHLVGARARVTTTENARYRVSGRAQGHRVDIGLLSDTGDGYAQLPLDEARDLVEVLLAATDDIDETATLRLEVVQGPQAPPLEVKVRRYPWAFEPVPTPIPEAGIDLVLQNISGQPSPRAAVSVELMRLWAPWEPPHILALSNGTWRITPADLEPGPWLAVGFLGDRSVVRPLRVVVPGEEPEATSDYQKACRTADRLTRWDTFRTLLADLSTTPKHPSWEDYRRLLQQLGRLPAPTFDLVRLTPDVPSAAVCALLRSDGIDDLWDGLEELPFLWCCVPLSAWRAGLAHNRELLGSFAGVAVNTLFELRARAPFLQPILQRLLPEFGLGRQVDAQTATMGMLPVFVSSLVSRHPDVNSWPSSEHISRAVQGLSWWPGPNTPEGMAPVLLAPAAAALLVAECAPESWADRTCRAQLLLEIRRLRAFDEDWFDLALPVHLSQLLAR